MGEILGGAVLAGLVYVIVGPGSAIRKKALNRY